MKKEIIALVNSTEEGYFRLNNISKLYRLTKDALNQDCDVLKIEFDNINHVYFGMSIVDIKSRDFDGIIAECQQATTKYLEEVARTLNSNIAAGYRNRTN